MVFLRKCAAMAFGGCRGQLIEQRCSTYELRRTGRRRSGGWAVGRARRAECGADGLSVGWSVSQAVGRSVGLRPKLPCRKTRGCANALVWDLAVALVQTPLRIPTWASLSVDVARKHTDALFRAVPQIPQHDAVACAVCRGANNPKTLAKLLSAKRPHQTQVWK